MKFSLSWLNEWLSISLDSKKSIEKITMSGFKVDNIELISKEFFSKIVIGYITSCYENNKIEKTNILNVDIGKKNNLKILCNDKNICSGLKVAVAGSKSFLFKKIIGNFKLNKPYTEGIICSYKELGINHSSNEIVVLPSDAPIGKDIFSYLKLDDKIIDIDIPPNRSDCFCVLGIVRDIAACSNSNFKKIVVNPINSKIDETISIKIKSPKDCPVFIARIIKDINVKSITPFWMKLRLSRCGIKTDLSIKDIINYVLLELGQPIQVFNEKLIKGSIIVRWAIDGENIILPNGKNTVLSSDTLLITDYNKIIAIAGISNTIDFEINNDTNKIILICANFNPCSIRGRANYYGLFSEISKYYERGVDPNVASLAIERATELILKICGGKAGPITKITEFSELNNERVVKLYRSNLYRIVGCTISNTNINNILTSLGFKFSNNQEIWKIKIPSWRFDINIEEDIIEEILRLYGYKSIPNIPIKSNLSTLIKKKNKLSLNCAKKFFIDHGYNEVITYSFVNPKLQELLHPEIIPLKILNPISINMSVMRLSLWTGLIEVAIYNKNRQKNRIRIFETGFCFIPEKNSNYKIKQNFVFSGVITGPRFEEHWSLPHRYTDFYDIKGNIEDLLELAGIKEHVSFKPTLHSALHPKQNAAIYNGKELIGFIGTLHPNLEIKFNLDNKMVIFEIFWEKLSKYNCSSVVKTVSLFPFNRRDISLIVDENIHTGDLIKECKKAIPNKLVKINVFDVYFGKNIKRGLKSLSISLILQDINSTMKEYEISKIIEKCKYALKKKFMVSFRD